MRFYLNHLSSEEIEYNNLKSDSVELSCPNFSMPIGTHLEKGSINFYNQDLTVSSEKMVQSINISNRKVIAKEKKVTPAGTFDCIVLSNTFNTKTSTSVKSKEWYAKDIGLVAYELYAKDGSLIEKTLLTRSIVY
jgi:hypothetical protein